MKLLQGDALEVLKTLPDGIVQTVVTSPPYYGLRDYGVDGQIGLEETPEAYITKLVAVFREVLRVLKDDGCIWVNIGDSYAREGGQTSGVPRHWDGRKSDPGGLHNLKPLASEIGLKGKDLIGIPWMLAFALRADGWYLRQDIIWAKPNPMPESVTDRCTKSHEYIFLLSKSARYYMDMDAIAEQGVSSEYDIEKRKAGRMEGSRYLVEGVGQKEVGASLGVGSTTRNKRSVWTVTTKAYSGAHFATFPPDLIEPCILAGSKLGDIVLDPFNGSGTTGAVALKYQRDYIGIELNPAYITLTERRLRKVQIMLVLP